MRNRFALFAILSIGILFTACQKDTPLQDAVDNLVTAEDLVIASNMIQDTEDQIDELVETRGADDCATVVVVPSSPSVATLTARHRSAAMVLALSATVAG